MGTSAAPVAPPSGSSSTAELPSPPPGPSTASRVTVIDEDDAGIEMIEHPTIPPFPAPPPKSAFPMKAKTTATWANAVAGSSSFAELLDYIADGGQSLVGTEEMVAEDCPDAAVSQPGRFNISGN